MEWTKDRITGVPAANTCSEMENSAVGQHPEDFAPTHKTNRDYQPTSHNKKVNPHFEGSPYSNVSPHHMVGLAGFEPTTP